MPNETARDAHIEAFPPENPDLMDRVVNELEEEDEPLNPALIDKLNQSDLLEAKVGVDLKEYIRHSSRFSLLARRGGIFGHIAAIPQTHNNLDVRGDLRRHEEGPVVDMGAVVDNGVDPSHVLYFRVTQPSEAPKAEYYWTRELGAGALTAVILVSTLAAISQNGGLIRDMNDDDGIAVRQIGFEAFDQSEALAVLSRH